MELNQLKYLVKMGEVQNFSKASEDLFIAQPTLSQQIKRLEDELGVKLFERSTRKVVLTDIGKICVSYAREALRNIDDIQSAAEKYRRREKSRILIGMLNIMPRMDIMNVITQFEEENPDIVIEWNFGWSVDLVRLLLQRKLDLVISNVTFDESDELYSKIEISPFLEEPMVAVVSKRSSLANYKRLRIDNIINETFWCVDANSSVKLGFEHAIYSQGFDLPKFEECSSMSSVIKMVSANQGISVMSASVAREYHTPQVKSIPIVPKIKKVTALMTLKDAKLSLKQQKFRDYFLSAISRRAERQQ